MNNIKYISVTEESDLNNEQVTIPSSEENTTKGLDNKLSIIAKKPLLFIIPILAIILICVLVLSGGNPDYQARYSKATGSEKENILRENIVAVLSYQCSKELTKPSSFELIDAWIWWNGSEVDIALEFKSDDSSGVKETFYCNGYCSNDDNKVQFGGIFTDLRQEQFSKSYGQQENKEILKRNLYKNSLQYTMTYGEEISYDSVENINELHKRNKLKKVKQINAIPNLKY